MRPHAARRVEVLAQDVGDRMFTVWLDKNGRPGARGIVDDPFASWKDVIDRLLQLRAHGARRARVRIVSLSLRLTSAQRRAIAEIERAGMRLTFEALELGRGLRP
ncbi:MAG TPA: hypothetical protein VK989_13315 [Polyangia bacterium]|jgi:hypothetical protein|nr:hypothetical protein [Polyangia bacterium]